jgi:hypothetical protein
MTNEPLEIGYLNELVEKERIKVMPNSSKSDFFNYFCSELILKNFGLGIDQILAGITDGRADGQIDSLYVLINDRPVFDAEDLPNIASGIKIRLIALQSKSNGSFKSNALAIMWKTLRSILNPSIDISRELNEKLRSIAEVYRVARLKYLEAFPETSVEIYYATNGAKRATDELFNAEIATIERELSELISTAKRHVEALGAVELYKLASARAITTRTLQVEKLGIEEPGNAYVVLAKIKDYIRFISNAEGGINFELFEENVRDYLGDQGVNEKIAQTIRDEKSEEFWWLNNGVTIVAKRAEKSREVITVEDPQIVNGLQTSYVLHRNKSVISNSSKGDQKVLIRILQLNNEESRDSVIQSTNSQSSLPPSSLVVGEKIHKDLEFFLLGKGYFYERRKNYYKNQRKEASKIISIDKLTQAIIAVVLGEPDMARARPGDFIRTDRYAEVFPEARSLETYYVALIIVERSRELLVQIFADRKAEMNNYLYHVSYAVSLLMFEAKRLDEANIANFDPVNINARIVEALNLVEEAFKNVMKNLGTKGDQAAKSKEMRKAIESRARARLNISINQLGGLFDDE